MGKINIGTIMETKKRFKVGYTTGTFDLFHVGHLNILEKAKEYKGESPIISFEDRIRIIRALKCVDKAIPQRTMNKLDVLEDIQYDVLFHGDDWKNTEIYNEIEEKLAEKNISCVYFPYTKSISTQSIKEKVKQG